MSLTNAPAIVTTLSTQLAACASWPGGATTNHWYPEAPTGSTAPFGVLAEVNRRRQIYAADAPSLPGGTLSISVYSTGTIGTLEDLGRSLLAELLTQHSGIAFTAGEVGYVADTQGATDAAQPSTALRTITISLEYGVNP